MFTLGGWRLGSGYPLNGDIEWSVMGSGTLTDSDAATLNNTAGDPTRVLPGQPTFLWTADTASYQDLNHIAETSYGYDSAARLETVSNPDGSSQRYCYDNDSNRTKVISPSTGTCSTGTTTSTYAYATGAETPVDALTSQTGPSRSFSYDGGGTALGDGEMTGRGSDSLSYDDYGRLKSATVGGNTVCYTYSPDGSLLRRDYKASATNCTSPTSTTNYLLGDLYETNGSGTTTTSYVDGPAGDLGSFAGPPSTGSTISYLYYDGHGNLEATADSSGNEVSTNTYDPFGGPSSAPSNTTTHLYVGRWNKQYDSTSSLVLMGARPYDPALGRFLAVDPVDGGSLNNYDYSAQDPVNKYDLNGLSIPLDSRSYGAHGGTPVPGALNGNAPSPVSAGDPGAPGGIITAGGSVIPPPLPYDPAKLYASVPNWIKALDPSDVTYLKRFWNVASYEHDVCYGSQFPKAQCDAEFYISMDYSCADSIACQGMAYLWYVGVRDAAWIGGNYKPRHIGEP